MADHAFRYVFLSRLFGGTLVIAGGLQVKHFLSRLFGRTLMIHKPSVMVAFLSRLFGGTRHCAV